MFLKKTFTHFLGWKMCLCTVFIQSHLFINKSFYCNLIWIICMQSEKNSFVTLRQLKFHVECIKCILNCEISKADLDKNVLYRAIQYTEMQMWHNTKKQWPLRKVMNVIKCWGGHLKTTHTVYDVTSFISFTINLLPSFFSVQHVKTG